MKTIRLIYPQWQGGDISRWIPEIEDRARSARGYWLGAQLLNFLVPAGNNQETYTVPVRLDPCERTVTDGVMDRDIIAAQAAAALDILKVAVPDRIVTLGGECSASVVPFTYLADRYGDDVAVIWIDAHPDITLPGDVYAGYHAMAVTACMGLGDSRIVKQLPARIEPSKILYVGLRDWEREEIRLRQQEYGIRHLTREDIMHDSGKMLEWIKGCGASKIMIHFDMDVLDPAEILPAVGIVTDGMRMAEVIRVINDAAAASDLVALTIAEPMPRTAIRLQMMLEQLPLITSSAMR